MDDFFAMMGFPPEKLELQKPAIKTAAPAPVSTPTPPPPPIWYDNEQYYLDYLEGGRAGGYVGDDGMVASYVDRKNTNIKNKSYDPVEKGVWTVGNGFTFNPVTGASINRNTKITQKEADQWNAIQGKSFDEEASKRYPGWWSKAKDYEKEAVYAYFHQFTGWGQWEEAEKKTKIRWNFESNPGTRMVDTLLKKGYNVVNNAEIQQALKWGNNKNRNLSISRYFKDGSLYDFYKFDEGKPPTLLSPPRGPQRDEFVKKQKEAKKGKKKK